MTYDETHTDDDFTACFGSPHWMATIPVLAGTPRAAGTVNVWWRCTRCGTERRDVLNATTLQNEGRRYKRPPGWSKRKGGENRAMWKARYLEQQGVITDREATMARRHLAAQIQTARDEREKRKRNQ